MFLYKLRACPLLLGRQSALVNSVQNEGKR